MSPEDRFALMQVSSLQATEEGETGASGVEGVGGGVRAGEGEGRGGGRRGGVVTLSDVFPEVRLALMQVSSL